MTGSQGKWKVVVTVEMVWWAKDCQQTRAFAYFAVDQS